MTMYYTMMTTCDGDDDNYNDISFNSQWFDNNKIKIIIN